MLTFINETIKDKPTDMTIVLHICRRNLHSSWFAAGGYEPIAKELFSKCKVDVFFLNMMMNVPEVLIP